MKIERAKVRALELLNANGYLTLFEKLTDECAFWDRDWGKEDGPYWSVKLVNLHDSHTRKVTVVDEQIELLCHHIQVGPTACILGTGIRPLGHNAHLIITLFLNDRNVLTLEYSTRNYELMNVEKEGRVEDIHAYHHKTQLYRLLDDYRVLVRDRRKRVKEAKEKELQKVYKGCFSFDGLH